MKRTYCLQKITHFRPSDKSIDKRFTFTKRQIVMVLLIKQNATITENYQVVCMRVNVQVNIYAC